MKRIIENYYLNEKNNKIIVVIMLMNAALCILVCYTNINTIFGLVCNLFTFIGISVMSIKKNPTEIEGRSISRKEIYVNRKMRFNLFQGKKGILILTGDSGIGKSCLLYQFIDSLDNKEDCIFIDNNYFYDWDFDDFEKKKYVILDQFEKALTNINFEDKISFLKKLKSDDNLLIIISIRKEYLGDIYNAFNFDKDINLLWLNYDNNEIKEIRKYLQKIIGESNVVNKNYELYNDIINDLLKGGITFIQLSYISKSIQQSDHSIYSINQEWIKQKDYNALVYSFIERQIDNYLYKDLAYLILYLMCQDKKGLYISQMADFQNISMQSQSDIEATLEFLCDQNLIKRVQTSEGIRALATEKYEISHDYVLDLLDNLCKNKIDSNIRSNIEFYNKNYQIKRNEYKVEKESSKEVINRKYKSFLDYKSKIYVDVLLYAMVIAISVINCYVLSSLLEVSNKKDSCLILAAINIMVGESIYYIYNYYYQFMRIFGVRYIISIIVGTVCCLLAYLNTNYWAICLGTEIVLMGVLMLFINIKVRKPEKKFFITRFGTFSAIGAITLILGYYFPVYANGKIKQAIPLFFLYGGYMFLGIWGHINKTYILALIGKTLLIGKDLEVK